MAETGRPQAAVERSNKRKIQQHCAAVTFLETDQVDTDLQESGSSIAYVENSSDCGHIYLNPLTPKWNCGISETCLEIISVEEDGIWVQNKDNDARRFTENAKKMMMSKVKATKFKKHCLVPQTSNGNRPENLSDFSLSSEDVWGQSQDNSEGRTAAKRTLKQVTPTLKLLDVRDNSGQKASNGIKNKCLDVVSSVEKEICVQRTNDKIRFLDSSSTFSPTTSKLKLQNVKKSILHPNRNSEIMDNLSDTLSTSSEEMLVQRKDNSVKTVARTSKESGQKIIVRQGICIISQSKQSTNEKYEGENNCVILPFEGQEKTCHKSKKCIQDKKITENDKVVTTKLKDLQVKDNQLDRFKESKSVKCKDDSKISRFLEAMKKRSEIDTEQRPFKCPHCHWAFKKLCYLQSHITTHSGLKPHVCDTCGKAYSHQGTLQQHKRLHTGERPYHCPFCDRSYIWSSDYRKHIRTHTGEKPYECKECGKDFIRSSDLRKHERNMHTNNKPFPCSHCGKTFNRPLSLKRHERKHLGERPFSCPDCGKKFALASRMAEHQKIHKGVRPYVCSVCGKSFTKSSNLTEHEAIHSGIRPHKCEECGVAFAMASRLVRHQYVHNKGKPHSCAGCGRNFSCLVSLEQHQQLNCSERIFVCVQCDKSFMCADKLTQHIKHHTEQTGPK